MMEFLCERPEPQDVHAGDGGGQPEVPDGAVPFHG